jgi:hypothetical protein
VKVHSLGVLICPPLEDIPEKNLILQQYYPGFIVNTEATYQCAAGHFFEFEVIQNVLYFNRYKRSNHYFELQNMTVSLECLTTGEWSMNVSMLPSCEAVLCNSPSLIMQDISGWSLKYYILLQNETSTPATTSLNVACPHGKYFYEDVNAIRAECSLEG